MAIKKNKRKNSLYRFLCPALNDGTCGNIHSDLSCQGPQKSSDHPIKSHKTKFIFLFFLIYIIITPSYSAKRNYKYHKKKTTQSNFRYSKKELKFGKYFSDFYKISRRRIVSKYIISKLVKLSKGENAFHQFNSSFKKIYSIQNIRNDLKKLKKLCSPKLKITNLPYEIQQRLFLYINKACRYKYLKILTKQHDKIDLEELKYFDKYLPFYLKGQFLNQFEIFLSKIKKDKILDRIISNLISEKIINSNIIPHENIIKNLEINNRLTTHIQNIGYYDSLDKRFFTKEFLGLIYDFKQSLNEKKLKDAFMHINHALAFYSQNKKYISQERVWNTFITSGKKFLYRKDHQKALSLFKHSQEIAEDDQVHESIFYQLLISFSNNDFIEGTKILERNGLIEQFPKLSSRLQFWAAYTILKKGEKELAKHLLKYITFNSMLDYYSIISLKVLTDELDYHAIKPERFIGDKNPHFLLKYFPLKYYKNNFKNAFKRILVWSKLNHQSLIFFENDYLISMNKKDALASKKIFQSMTDYEFREHTANKLFQILALQNKYLLTFKLIISSLNANSIKLNKFTLKKLFPKIYLDEIHKIEKKLDPLIILALIRQESAFNPKAKSSAGARGLMQIMPQTAKSIDRRVTISRLNKPKINLKIGIKYFKELLKNNDWNLIYTLASYNAGEGRVNSWKENLFVSNNPLVKIELIPFLETNQYVKLIYRNLFYYKLLDNKLNPKTSLYESFYVTQNSVDLRR